VPGQAATQAGVVAPEAGEYTRVMVDAVAAAGRDGSGMDMAGWTMLGTDGALSNPVDVGGTFHAGELQMQSGPVLHGYLYYVVGQLGAALETPAGKIELTHEAMAG